MDLLSKTEETFLMAFNRLFQSFDRISSSILPFFNLCFRKALNKSVFVTNFDVMLTIISKLPENSYLANDFFFSAFISDLSICKAYASNLKKGFLLQINPKCKRMPISFLKFLLLTETQIKLTDQIIWSFFQMSPSLIFELLDSYSESNLFDIWKKLLLKVQNYPQIQDIHLNIFYYLLLSSIKHPCLIKIFKDLNFPNFCDDIVFLKRKANSILSFQKISFLSLYLLFCRLDDGISNDFVLTYDLRSNLTRILSNKGQFEYLENFLIWVINPTNELFQMEGITFPKSKEIFSLLPPPSYTFSTKIAPIIISLLIKIGISDHFNDSSFIKFIDSINKINKWERAPNNLLIGITDISVLLSIISHAMKNDSFFNLLTSALSISCVFPVFYKSYSLISSNDQKLLNFLISISSTTPLVNDFLRIDSKHKLNFSCMNGTIVMWVRFLHQPVRIAKINMNSNIKIYIKRDENTFILEVRKGTSKFIPMNDDIGGWYFIVIEIKPKMISMSVNLAKVKIEGQFGQNATISIGKSTSFYDMQSFHFFRAELSTVNVCRLFSLGPNYKSNFVDNFITINGYESLFFLKNNFISSLYFQWMTNMKPLNLDTKNSEGLFGKNYEFGISPPYGQLLTTQKNSMLEKNNSILKKRFCFDSFINSLDSIGGISLVIHFLAEIILKKKELHSLAFSLFEILVSRFPFIHFYFEKNKAYQMIGRLLWKSSHDPKAIFKCAMSIRNGKCVVTNVDVVRYWLFGPSLFNCEFYDLAKTILDSLEGEFAEDNLCMLEAADCFSSLIKSISNSRNHSEKFLSVLMALALKLTNLNNAQNHASMIIKYLLVYHFKNPSNEYIQKVQNADNECIQKVQNNDNKCIQNNDNECIQKVDFDDDLVCDKVKKKSLMLNGSNEAVSLIHLLSQILFIFGKKVSVSLDLLLPMFINSPTPVLSSLYDLMMKYLPPIHHTSLIVAMSRSSSNSEFSEYVYSYSTSFIFKASENSYSQFYQVTIPILYLLSQERKEELIIAILSAAATILDYFKEYPSFIFDHLYRFLIKLTTMNKMSFFFGHEPNSSSGQITPFCHFLLKILICALFNLHSYECVKSFIHAFITLDQGEYSIFVIGYLFDRLSDYNYEKCSSNMQLMSNIVNDLFMNIPFILRERIVNPPPYIPFLIKNACNFIDFYSTPEIVNHFVFLLNEISFNSTTIAMSIVSIVSECKVIQSLPNFKEIICMLESPMMMLNSKPKKIALKFDSSKFLSFIENVGNSDIDCFLSLYCNSVLAQAVNAHSFFSQQEENDEMLSKWKEIFTQLNFPGSKIYENCPVKYKVDDSTVRYQVRRVLLPMNPSLDHQYLDFWETKYSNNEEKPVIKLTLNEVFEKLNYSHTNEILFTAESSRLHGTSIIQGFFVVTKKTIKFYGENDRFLNFNVGRIHSIRLIDYQHQPIGIFVNEKDMNSRFISNSAMFAFKAAALRNDFINNIEKNFQIKIVRSIDFDQLNSVTFNWSAGRITNFDYLLYLNFLSGRTWSDLTRYPIFPWVCLDFSKSGPVKRDLKFPFFAQTEEQKSSCLKYYKMTQEIPDELPHYYSNYVSNVGSTLYFLVRLEPFTTEEIEYQGGRLDSPDRSFQSFEIAANVMTNPGEKSTLELIPEAYFMPDFLINVNKIKFPMSPIKKVEISDVKLPHWATTKFTKLKPKQSTVKEPKLEQSTVKEPKLEQSTVKEPKLEQSTVKEPKLEQSTVKEPKLEQSTVKEPKLEQSTVKEPKLEQSTVKEPKLEQSTVKEPKLEQSTVKEPKLEQSTVKEPKLEQSTVKEPKLEQSTVKEPKLEQSTVKEPKLEQSTVKEPKLEQSTVKEPKLEQSTVKEPKLEQSTVKEPKLEQSTVKEPKLEQSAVEEQKAELSRQEDAGGTECECLSPFKFVRKMRRILESDEISSELNEWIDLIWGVRRSGSPASERFNVFSPIIYKFDERKYYDDQKLLNAFSSLMHNCGQAPLQLFADFHPKRSVGHHSPSILSRKQNLTLSSKNENKRPSVEDLFNMGFDVRSHYEKPECFSMSDRSVITHDGLFDCFIRMRIIQKVDFLSSIEIEKIDFEGKSAKTVINFSNEIEPRLICTSKNGCDVDFTSPLNSNDGYGFLFNFPNGHKNSLLNCNGFVDFIISHKIPIINHWHFLTEKCQIVHVSTLRGHQQEITAIALNSIGSTVFAGHSDGVISAFRINPDSFIRTFSCKRKMPISKVAVLADNSSLLVVQNVKMCHFFGIENKKKSSFLSLFEINGRLISEIEIECEDVLECALTSFCSGLQTNLAFLLTRSSKIFAVSMNSLKRKAIVDTGSAVIESISLWNNVVLVALTNANSLISWNLFDLEKNVKK